MKILIIDDNPDKRSDVADAVSSAEKGSFSHEVEFSDNLSEAVRKVSQNAYDVIVLDLLLPYLAGGDTDPRAGLELLRIIKQGDNANRTAAVVGLSAHPEELESSRFIFESHGVLLIAYDPNGRWREVFYNVLKNNDTGSRQRQRVDFIIMVALLEERAGLEQAGFEFLSDLTINGLNIKYTRWERNSVEKYGVVVLLRQMGLVNATLETAISLSTFDTKILCMSGICAGFSKRANLGQILIAGPAWEYQAGKWSADGFQIAPNQVPLPPRTRLQIEKICQEPDIIASIESNLPREMERPSKRSTPTIVPFASGSAVIADSSKLSHIEVQHRQVAGIDMEVYGMYLVAHELCGDNLDFFAAKCVVDLADQEKNDDLHGYGCFASASMIWKFFERSFLAS